MRGGADECSCEQAENRCLNGIRSVLGLREGNAETSTASNVITEDRERGREDDRAEQPPAANGAQPGVAVTEKERCRKRTSIR